MALSAIEAGNVLFLAVITYQIGMLAFGPLDRVLDTRKWIAVGGSLVTVVHPRNPGARVAAADVGARRRHPRHGLLLAPPAPW